MKIIVEKTTGYTILPGMIEISNLNLMIESLFFIEVNVKNAIYGNRLSSDLTIGGRVKSLNSRKFTNNFFLHHTGLQESKRLF